MQSTEAISETVQPSSGVAARAAELLVSVINVLQEDSAASSSSVRSIVSKIDRALDELEAAGHLEGSAFGSAVESASSRLAAALQLARQDATLTERQSQSMEAVARAMALLHPILRDHGVQGPPPIPWRRPKPADSKDERRRHQRVTYETEVTFESEHNFFTGFTEDISEGGLFFATYELQPIGTKMDITFTLPNGHIVSVEGVVRWLRDPRDEEPGAPPGMGMQFGELLPEDRDAIHRFIEARAPLFYED